jgi:hypothetical protein
MPALNPFNNTLRFARFILLLSAALSGQSLALDPDSAPLQENLQSQASVDEIARKINQQPQWRILAAEPMVEDQKVMYRFKVLNENHGRVEVIVIDPEQPELEQFNINTNETD